MSGVPTSKFVEFEREGDRKEEQLITNCYQKSNCEIVVIQYVDFHLRWRVLWRLEKSRCFGDVFI